MFYVLGLKQVSQISQHQWHTCQVPTNLDTVEQMDRLDEVLVAVGSVLASTVSPVHLAVACMVVWKLAESAGERVLGTKWWGGRGEGGFGVCLRHPRR